MRRILGALALLAVVLVFGAACGGGPEPRPRASSPDSAEPAGASSEIAASCVEIYSPQTLAKRSFAFDGTLVSIESRTDPKLPPGEPSGSWVTFDVHEWFEGGSGETVGIWMDFLNVETSAGTITAEPGTRLLVAGEPRWGGPDPLADPIAWTCGFTQQWSEEAAAEWEAATA